jgi:tripartite-type tricarboxylate transporter receptor subunit TctC
MCKTRTGVWSGICLAVSFCVLIAWVNQAQSQDKYPTRAIEIIVPFAAGGGQDTSARLLSFFLKAKLGVPVNVLNKPGGNTVPANIELYHATPDGYTLSLCQDASNAMLQVLTKDLSFNVLDRTFVSAMMKVPHVFTVPSNSPFKRLKEVAEDARKDPEHFTWASLGGMSGPDLFLRQFFKAAGVDVRKTKPVMCKGASEAIILAAGGNVKLAGTTPTAAKPSIAAGTIRPLTVTEEMRSEFPNLPTTAEEGFPTINHSSWYFFSGPPKLPPRIVETLSNTLKEISKDPEYVSRVKKIDLIPFYADSAKTKENLTKLMEEVSEIYGVKKP